MLCSLVCAVFVCSFAYGQKSGSVPQRTPEHEASKQTEKMQVALELSDEQVKKVYDINLFYERERQLKGNRNISERIKNKNADLKKVLTKEQYQKLQQMRGSGPLYDDSPQNTDKEGKKTFST